MKHKFNVGDVVEVTNARYNSYGKSCIVKEFRHTFNPCFEVEYLLHTGEVVYGDVDLQLITKPKKSWKENKPMEEIKRSTPKFHRGDKVKVMRDEVFTVDEVVTTESKHGITHEYFVDDNMDLLQENELILVEDTEIKEEPKIIPYTLLKDGVFGMDSRHNWFVVLGNHLIYQRGNTINMLGIYSESLQFMFDDCRVECLIANCASFDEAKKKWISIDKQDVIWKRTT